MRILHGRWRQRTSLLAAQVLDASARERAQAHVERCVECARDLAASRAALALAARDPRRGAEPPLPLGALVARVQARIDQARPSPARWRLAVAGASAVAAVAIALALARTGPHVALPVPALPVWAPSAAPSATTEGRALPADALQRIDRALERERAARYLSEAGDVLVTVASAPQRCARRADQVEVGAEAQRSRELLARRRLLVEADAPAVVAARDVLDDVEEMLRQVAALDPCTRPQDLEAIREEIARRRLLMKIDLVTRELQG